MAATELSHVRRGEGEPLLLVHGLGGAGMIWDPVLDLLAAERDVVAIDMPGFGRSPELPEGIRPTPANLGRAIAEFLAELGIDRPHVAGNSLGGWVVLEMAKAGDASSVCCLSPAGLWRSPLGPRERDARPLAMRLRPLLGPAMALPGVRRALLRSSVAEPDRLSREEAIGLIGGWLDSTGYEAANREMRAGVFEHPELVGVPTTIAWGSADRLLGPPRSERMPPGTRYVVLEGAGHTPTWDDPVGVSELILESSSLERASAA